MQTTLGNLLFSSLISIAAAFNLYSAEDKNINKSNERPHSASADELPKYNNRDYFLGDEFGYRQKLHEAGIDLDASFTTEPAWNPTGGERQSATTLHNFGLSAQFDLEPLIGLRNTTFTATGSQRSGDSLAEEAIGSAISVQQIFGGGQTHRLVELRMQHKLFQERLELSYGRLSTTSDFLTSPFYCEFVTNGICGQPTSPFFNMSNGITAYPVAAWGAVARFQTLTKETYSMFGVYDGGPVGQAGGNDHGVDFDFGDNGALLISEVGYQPQKGFFGLPGRYSIGAFHHTGDFPHVAVDSGGGNLFLTNGIPREMSEQNGYYLIFEQMFHRTNPETNREINGFLTAVVSPDEEKSPVPYFFNSGVIYQGLLPSRPNDQAAVGMYTAWFGSDLRDAQQAGDVPSQTYEAAVELNYQVQMTPYSYIRPNIQYVVNPNGLSEVDDALVLGFELGITL